MMFWLFIAAGFGLISLAHAAPFPFFLDALAPARALWSMPERVGAPMVYLTFDDGPNPTATPGLLDVLTREGAVATFFLIDRHLTEETGADCSADFRRRTCRWSPRTHTKAHGDVTDPTGRHPDRRR